MKRLILLTISVVMSFMSMYAQSDVTKFLGIPVDGFKPDMIRALKAKGFVSSITDKEILEGEFNGTQVNVYTATNNNKVYRIMVCDAKTMGETDIRIRFNKLCDQFSNNKNYIELDEDGQKIPDDEDIRYEISVHDKRYEAIFYQVPNTTDTLALQNDMKAFALTKYSEERKRLQSYVLMYGD